jgi:hypothetical protein
LDCDQKEQGESMNNLQNSKKPFVYFKLENIT